MRTALFLIAAISTQMLSAKVGIFEDTSNIGNPPIKGSTLYDPDDQSYLVTGSGKDVWGPRDECHFAHRKIKGDFVATADVETVGEITHLHQKTGWMARVSLDDDSSFISAAAHADGHAAMQWRPLRGAGMRHYDDQSYGPKPNYQTMQLERAGDRFTVRAAHPGEPLQELGSLRPREWPDEILIGWFTTSHNREEINQARVWNVRIDRPVGPDSYPLPTPADVVAYKPEESGWLGCRLETINVFSGVRKIIHESAGRLGAPNWMPDGKHLLFDEGGLIYTIPVEGGTPAILNTGSCNKNNNDHAISFDGKKLAISNGGSAIFVLPISGGEPELVTEKTPSYLHGWNPNGKELVFVGNRNGENYDIFSIPVGGGKEVNLSNIEGGHADGPEFSPDGETIYFNSSRTGTMQIWRMNPDGSKPEQLTFDQYNDWFPHISPDGYWMAYLSFPSTIDPDTHPSYKRVTLRLMPLKQAGAPRVIAYLYGGQGTLNVPSWAPDSRHLAFVSNSGRPE